MTIRIGKRVIASLVLAVGVVAFFSLRTPCSSWRDCYLFLHRVQNGQSNSDQHRQVLLDHFAASLDKIAFSVLMPDNRSVGLLIADRHSGALRIIFESEAHFGQPYFSADGRRFLLVRARYNKPYRELLSCQIRTWRCDVVVQTQDAIMFPLEVNADTILYSSSPMRTAPDGRKLYNRYDLYVVRKGSEPSRLTEFGLHELGWLNVDASKVVFGAEAAPNNPVLPPSKLVQMYSVKFDRRKLEVVQEALPLAPIFYMDTLSIRPTMSQDGQHVAFLKVESVGGKYRYNMTVATLDGTIQHSVKVEGIALSHGAFVGDSLLFDELFKDHYRVRQLDLNRGAVDDVLTLNHSTETLKKLDPIRLQVDDGERSAQQTLPALPN